MKCLAAAPLRGSPHHLPAGPAAYHPRPLQAASGERVSWVVDKEDVLQKIGDLLKKQDLSKYVL